ncbi:septum formation family protein [Gordonia alkaliphila]|uniref:Septum formation-related domain-containing protein n=1 Tax=Gordonia alkaliphila TaxID=1053547 RepID=A0ABP8YZY1_9ACTN
MTDPELEPQGPEDDGAVRRRVSATRLVTVLVAVLVGAAAAGGVIAWRGGFSEAGGLGESVIGEGNSYTETDFTRSVPGDCLTWADDTAGTPSKVSCEQPHRFEVAGTVDTEQFPGAEFGATAPWPGPERFVTVRDEQCGVLVDRYLGSGGLDPQGRLAVGLMYPSKSQWERGARVLRCGIEEPGPGGTQLETAGTAADADQSFAWPDGTCIGFDDATRKPTTQPVDCSEPHAFQTTGVVDLSQRFGGRDSGKPWPTVAAQNEYLQTICPNQTNRFFGGEKNFAKTTLNVQWSVISEVSWHSGSRRVVCYVALPDRGGFAKLVGDAREQVLINGKVPTAPAQGPPGRALPTPVPLPPGYAPSDREMQAPSGG